MSHNPTYKRLINTSRWQTLRRWQLGHKPWCEMCLERNVHELATEVHHIQPCESVRNEDDMARLMYDPSNLMSLCHRCHADLHQRMHGRRKGVSAKERTRKHNETLLDCFKRRFLPSGEG